MPLHYATRYNLAFGQLVPQAGGAYSIEMGNFAAQVKALIHKKRPNAQIWASTGPDGGGRRRRNGQQGARQPIHYRHRYLAKGQRVPRARDR